MRIQTHLLLRVKLGLPTSLLESARGGLGLAGVIGELEIKEGVLEAVRVHSGENVGQNEHDDYHSHCEEKAGMRPAILVIQQKFSRGCIECLST